MDERNKEMTLRQAMLSGAERGKERAPFFLLLLYYLYDYYITVTLLSFKERAESQD